MKRKELINKIVGNGYKFLRHGSCHDLFSNGKRIETVPRHKNINEVLAKTIIKRCSEG